MIRHCIFTLALTLGCMLSSSAQSPGDAVFGGIQVHTINLRFSQPDYWDSLKFYYAQGDEKYIIAQAVIDGESYDRIGVRLKGNSSYNHPNDKKSFRLAFDEYVDTCRWDGLKGVHLNNMWGDPSFMREKLHLDFCRDAGIAAPHGNYARLLINDTLFAFYSMVEHVDKTLLDSRFSNKSGDLFKAVDGYGAMDTVYSDFRWFGSDTTLYLPRYELKTDGSVTAWPQLIGFIDTLANQPDPESFFSRKVDLPLLCRTFATDNLLGNLDSYIGSGRNFYLYFHSKTGVMKWVAWDAGLSFGAYGALVPNPKTMSVTYSASGAVRPLLATIFNKPTLKNEYLQSLCGLVTTQFTEARLFPHIDSIANIIRPYIAEDQRKMYTTQQFETNLVADITATGGGSVTKPGLKNFISQRSASVVSQLAALGISCTTGIESDDVPHPLDLELSQNYPNPAARSTLFRYFLPEEGHAILIVYDALGRVVTTLIDRVENAGMHSIRFDAGDVPSGIYRCVLTHGSRIAVRTAAVLH